MAFTKEKVSTLNSARIKKLAPNFASRVAKVADLAREAGFTLLAIQGLRTFAEQDALFAQGRTKKGKIVTNARGGQSNHNYGLAADFVFIVKGEASWEHGLYKNIGVWAKAAGLDWGGNWKTIKDMPHVEAANCPNYRELLPIYKKHDLREVWRKFDKI